MVYDDPSVAVPAQAATLEGFRAWAVSEDFPRRGRVCWIDGEMLIEMSPEGLERHNKIKAEVVSELHALAREEDIGTLYGDRALLTHEAARLCTESDALFARWETFRGGRLWMNPRAPEQEQRSDAVELVGSPDWVLEVVSPSSIRKDTRKLRRAYHRAGVREYWLIDALGEKIDFQLLSYQTGGYEPVRPREGWRCSPVFGRRFRLDMGRDPLGHRRYTLRVQ